MPTQEQINAANVELEIANDNYAALADRYNKYKEMFQSYANATPEAQDRAADAMGRALEDFYQTQEKMRAAEDRIAVAQNAVNAINETIAQQQAIQQQAAPSVRRRTYREEETPIKQQAPVLINNPVFNRLNEQQYLDNYRNPQFNASPAIITNNEGIYGTMTEGPVDRQPLAPAPIMAARQEYLDSSMHRGAIRNNLRNLGYHVQNNRAVIPGAGLNNIHRLTPAGINSDGTYRYADYPFN